MPNYGDLSTENELETIPEHSTVNIPENIQLNIPVPFAAAVLSSGSDDKNTKQENSRFEHSIDRTITD